MVRPSKRKHRDDHRSKHGTNQHGVEASNEAKKRRLSTANPANVNMSKSDVRPRDDGQWQTVVSKSSRKKQQQASKRKLDDEDEPPRLYFQQEVSARDPVRIDGLRNLALYALSDTIAPTWVAVRNSRAIQKVVVIMLPGLDTEIVERAKEMLKVPENAAHEGSTRPAAHDDSTSSIQNGSSDVQAEPLSEPDLEDTRSGVASEVKLGDLKWLVDGHFPVKAPSDPQRVKVYSPLQAMLFKGLDDADRKSQSKQSERDFPTTRTKICEFIHTAEELRDAEYPIHPASFSSASDAALERERRKASGQSTAEGWADSDVKHPQVLIPAASLAAPRDDISQGLTIYAIDCEMVLTSDEKSSLARISVISWPDGKVVFDEYVKPMLPITNYFTQFSGITEEILKNVITILPDIQRKLLQLLTPSTILLGHSLESDLNAMKITHPFIIDTSMIYPHPRGLPLRSSLKFLANKYLKREIQKGGADGHDSVEDAKAVLDLVKLKCEKGPKWGTNEANGESVFKYLSKKLGPDNQARTSAMVEYGTPERGFGKDATYTIGCQDDEAIVKGVIRAAKGDQDGHEIPDGGVDFVWGRLRALEFERGWGATNYTAGHSVNNNNSTNNTNNNNSSASKSVSSSSTTTIDKGDSANGTPTANHSPSEPDTTSTPNLNDQDHKTQQNNVKPANSSNKDIHQTTSALETTLLQTLKNIQEIRSSLPPNTLLILYSGTSEMTTVTRLQTQQAQYRRAFKVKKWDELTVQWTDTEEQALRKAVDEARMGWGWVGIV